MSRINRILGERTKSIILLLTFGTLTWGLATLVIRLHLTQLAYEFESLKKYQRSLKEEQLRLRAELAEKLSISQLQSATLHEPEPNQVVRLP